MARSRGLGDVYKRQILHTYKAGTRVKFIGFYHGQTVGGSDRWYVVDEPAHARVHESGIVAWG
jgi:hypothetical protein